jgi:hypothetical protein
VGGCAMIPLYILEKEDEDVEDIYPLKIKRILFNDI